MSDGESGLARDREGEKERDRDREDGRGKKKKGRHSTGESQPLHGNNAENPLLKIVAYRSLAVPTAQPITFHP